MPFISPEQQKIDPDWWAHLKLGDTFHTGNPVQCGICGCKSDYWEVVRWMVGTKIFLICPGNKLNRYLHQKIDRKKELLYKDMLPASATDGLKREIVQLKAQLQAEVAEMDAKRS